MKSTFARNDNNPVQVSAVPAPRVLTCSEFARQYLGFEPDEKQRQVLDSEAKQGILNCCRQWGKSSVMAIKALYHAMFNDRCTVLIASPSARQSREMMRKCKEYARMLGMKVRGDGDNPISLQLRNGSRIVGLPGRAETVRSFAASLILVDEAAWVKDEMFLALSPMLATTNGAMWMLSTPNGSRGMFWRMWKDGGPDWERFEAPATECARIRPEFLEREKKMMGERRYAQEYGCQFVDNGDSYFSRDSVERAFVDNEVVWEV